MDNFEYSIQINDRDWAEFYSTAEECGMIQVSLATEEELLLSDPEPEDVTNRPKFIKVSLCPPQEDHQAIQSTPPVVSSAQHTRYTWNNLNEDVLSGSEDEEEFGSVTRFLCQRDTHLHKTRKVDASLDIPIPNQTEKQSIEHSDMEGVPVSLVDHMRALNMIRIQQYGETHKQPDTNELKSNIPATPDKDEDVGHSDNGCASCKHQDVSVRQDKSPQRYTPPSANVNGDPLPDHEGDSKIMESMICPRMPSNIYELDKSSYFDEDLKEVQYCTTVQDYHKETLLNMMKDGGEAQNKSEREDHKELSKCRYSSSNDSRRHNGLAGHGGKGIINGLQVMAHSSAAQQNFQCPDNGILSMCTPASFSLENYCMCDAPAHKPDQVATSVNKTPTCSHTANDTTEQTSPSKVFVTQHTPTGLTVPEMYDFFYDDISETNMAAKPETRSSQEDGIMYSPDMYEYFFLETQDDRIGVKGKQQTEEEAETELVGSSAEHPTSESFCVPEAYEFFFADGVDDQKTNEGGMVTSLQPSPQVLGRVRKGFPVRGTHYKVGRDGQLLVPSRNMAPGSTALVVTGSHASRIPAGTGDACLVLLALASWAVKSSDLQSSDGWKTALLANIGTVSAIRYLRRRSRRYFEEPQEPSGEGS